MSHCLILLRFLSLLFIFLLSSTLFALELAPPFAEGMVLQQKQKVAIWGQAAPQTEVKVILDKIQSTIFSDQRGRWMVHIHPPKAGGPYKLEIYNGDQQIVLHRVYVGEVWLAAGQSNMAFRLDKDKEANNTLSECADSLIRFMTVPLPKAGHPLETTYQWQEVNPQTAREISAVGYYFARQLRKKLQVPIGVIGCYKGGTAAEVWMSKSVIESHPDHRPIWDRYSSLLDNYRAGEYDSLYAQFERDLKIYHIKTKRGEKLQRPDEPMGVNHYKRPSGLYEQMFQPICPYTLQGVIWYQGEANAPRAEQYKTLFPATIAQWRKDLQNTNLPFLFVQLSNYDHPSYRPRPIWAELREAQLETSQKVAHTAMVVSIDCGAKDDIHPTQKRPIGERLASTALALTYRYVLPYTGPSYQKMEQKGDCIVLHFAHLYGGLTTAHNSPLSGFAICGQDQIFYLAKAIIEGKTVIVSCDSVPHPIAVRYGWDNWTEANLYNKSGFPASPFRTDRFPLLTKGVR